MGSYFCDTYIKFDITNKVWQTLEDDQHIIYLRLLLGTDMSFCGIFILFLSMLILSFSTFAFSTSSKLLLHKYHQHHQLLCKSSSRHTSTKYYMIANNINTMSVTAVDTNKKIKLDPDAVLVTDNDVVVPSSIDVLPKGIPDSFSIVKYSTIPSTGFTKNQITNVFSTEEITRLKLQPDNMTIPTALLLLFPEHFPTQTNARKDTRKKRILLHKGPLLRGQDNDTLFDREKLTLARVADRAQPGDTLAIQTRMEHNYDECKNHDKEAPFTLPVVYEDDHFAIVKKPEGIVVYSHKNGGFGRENVHSCLPWVLTPPKSGVMSVMRRPQPVHRIDRGTSGLLVCAKTKPAMQDLSKQFAERRAKKTCK